MIKFVCIFRYRSVFLCMAVAFVFVQLLSIASTGCRRPDALTSDDSAVKSAVVDPTKLPIVNPSGLTEVALADRSLIATEDTLFTSVKGSPSTLNPIFMSAVADKRAEELLYSRPITFDRTFAWRPEPFMVDYVTFSDDHLSATLKLKRGLTWHDGVAYTADDIVFSLQQIQDPRVPCPSGKDSAVQIVGCKALDPLTVQFEFKAPLPTNKWNINFGIIPKHIYEVEKVADPTLSSSAYYNKVNRAPIGNGPYRFVSWVADDRIVFERWEDYPGPKPYFKRIVMRIVPDASTRLLMFEKGEIDEMELTPEQFIRCGTDKRFAAVGVLGYASKWTFVYVGWNMDGSNPFFADRRVRRAMSFAVDYDRLIEQVYHGLFTKSLGLFHPECAAHMPKDAPYTFDLERAGKLLDEAGWRRDERDGWRYKDVVVQGESGLSQTERRKFSFHLLIPQGGATGAPTAAIYQEDLARIGVEMTPRMIEWTTFIKMINRHEFEAQILSFSAAIDPDFAWNVMHSESYDLGRNRGKYANSEVDRLFVEARGEFDPDRRMALYRQIDKIVYDDAPYTFIADAPTLWAFNRRLRGIQFSPRGPYLFHPGVLDWWASKEMDERIHQLRDSSIP